jgi:hypothetical protein
VGGCLKISTVSKGTFLLFRKSTDFRQVLQLGLRYSFRLDIDASRTPGVQ